MLRSDCDAEKCQTEACSKWARTMVCSNETCEGDKDDIDCGWYWEQLGWKGRKAWFRKNYSDEWIEQPCSELIRGRNCLYWQAARAPTITTIRLLRRAARSLPNRAWATAGSALPSKKVCQRPVHDFVPMSQSVIIFLASTVPVELKHPEWLSVQRCIFA